MLGGIQAAVGGGELVPVAPVLRIDGHATADRERGQLLRRRRRGGYCGTQAVGNRQGIGAGHAVQQHHEFLAADAANSIVAAAAAIQHLRHVAQRGIALQVAVRVVDALEMVDVEHDQGEGAPLALGAARLGEEALQRGAAIGDTGQGHRPAPAA